MALNAKTDPNCVPKRDMAVARLFPIDATHAHVARPA